MSYLAVENTQRVRVREGVQSSETPGNVRDQTSSQISVRPDWAGAGQASPGLEAELDESVVSHGEMLAQSTD